MYYSIKPKITIGNQKLMPMHAHFTKLKAKLYFIDLLLKYSVKAAFQIYSRVKVCPQYFMYAQGDTKMDLCTNYFAATLLKST